jgi:GH15 family glucan-1,4-alpha-glucosidase
MAKGDRKAARLVHPIERSRAVPIGDYGFLSDGEVSALVAPSGSVDWMCLPRFDAPSVFGAILGRRAGSFTVAPLGVQVPADRRYLPGTMILETSWGTATGWMIVRDVLLIGPWHHQSDRSWTYRRTPTDYEAEHVLLRTIRCVSGEVQLIMDCEPMHGYGTTPVDWTYTGETYHHGRAEAAGSDVNLTLTTDMLLGFEGGQASARTLLKQGETRFVALSWGGAKPPTTYPDAYRRLVWTAHHWPGSATRPSPCGGCTPSASTGRPSTSSPSSPTWPSAMTTCRSCTASGESVS